ncbi:MAG: YigZ family protein [Clostridia bacterium]|nr:YigZ family protein [Clostridia bacterium]
MVSKALVTLSGEGEFHLVEKKSEFIGYAAPVKNEAEALAFIEKIKQKHKDARHNVSAYVCGSAMHQSDDGEPQGTGGVPVLDVIKKNGIDNTVIVVTRYFGGILLGAGGLVRAYSRAAAGAVEQAGIVTYDRFTECCYRCAYGDYDKLTYETNKYTVINDGVEYSEEVNVKIAVLSAESDRLIKHISEITGGKVTVTPTGERFDKKQ